MYAYYAFPEWTGLRRLARYLTLFQIVQFSGSFVLNVLAFLYPLENVNSLNPDDGPREKWGSSRYNLLASIPTSGYVLLFLRYYVQRYLVSGSKRQHTRANKEA